MTTTEPTTTETFVEATRRSQEAYMQIWTDGVKRFWGMAPAMDGKSSGVPSAEEVVDNAFNFAEKVLATQREFIKTWLAVTRSVASSTAWLAQAATRDATAKKS